MMIGSITNTLATIPTQKRGNDLPVEGKSLPEKSDIPPNAIRSIERESSSIDELEVYFEEKISFLKENGHDTTSVIALRDAIREANENKSAESPSLPKVIEHPYGGKILGNIHLSFGTEVKGELKDFTETLRHLTMPNNITYSHLQKNTHSGNYNLAPGADSITADKVDALKDRIELNKSKSLLEARLENNLESFKTFHKVSSIDVYT